ncbi:hypothetical protein THAOC_12959, partial [Thalassiosira oceanica]
MTLSFRGASTATRLYGRIPLVDTRQSPSKPVSRRQAGAEKMAKSYSPTGARCPGVSTDGGVGVLLYKSIVREMPPECILHNSFELFRLLLRRNRLDARVWERKVSSIDTFVLFGLRTAA